MQKNCYQNNFQNNNQGRMRSMTDCGRNNAAADSNGTKAVAMAYVPWQKDADIYEDLEKAYCVGTVFPVLDLPFCGVR